MSKTEQTCNIELRGVPLRIHFSISGESPKVYLHRIVAVQNDRDLLGVVDSEILTEIHEHIRHIHVNHAL